AREGAVSFVEPERRLAAIRARDEEIEEPVVVVIPHRRGSRSAAARQSTRRGHVAEALCTTIVQEGVAATLVRDEEVDASVAVEVAEDGVARAPAGETEA